MRFDKFLENKQNGPTVVKSTINIPEECKVVAKALVNSQPNTEVYVVGGAVRDHLFGKKPKDFDLTTNLSEEQIVSSLRKAGLKVAEKDSDTFGVVFVHVTNGQEPIEVAPFRADVGVSDGRRPDSVQFGVSMQDDALRRDFTMNSLYYDFGFGRFGEGSIIDFNGEGQGIEDIKNGVVRPVGNPFDRFREDRFRILRLLRFFSRYNSGDITKFLDEQTLQAIKHYGNLRQSMEQLDPISSERIYGEFVSGLMQSQNTVAYLQNYVRLGLLENVFPGLQVDVQGISRVGQSKNPKVILAWLLRGNKQVDKALNKLKYPKEITDAVQFLIDSLNVGVENAFSIIKRRDRNTDISASLKKDLQEFAAIIGDPNLIKRLNHLSSYDMTIPSGQELMQRGLKGKEIGDEQRRQATDHYANSFADFLNQYPENFTF